MIRTIRFATPLALIATMSCSHSTPAPAKPPTPAPAPAAAPPAGGARGGAAAGGAASGGGAVVGGVAGGGRAGAPGGGGRGTPLTPEQVQARRDSLAGLRATAVQAVLATIAGKEDQPAGQVFKNVQLFKDMPAKKFVVMMDSTFGRALSNNCTSCHVTTDFSDDSRQGKVRARIMVNMVNAINADHLSKLPAGRGGGTPTITCITCHRGIGGNPGGRLFPPGA